MALVLPTPGCAQIFNLKFCMKIQSLWIVHEVEVPLVDVIISRTTIGPYHIGKGFSFHQIYPPVNTLPKAFVLGLLPKIFSHLNPAPASAVKKKQSVTHVYQV